MRVAYSTKFKDMQKMFNELTGTTDDLEGYLAEQEAKARRKVKRINYDDETKEMTIEYDDGTSKVFNEVEITDVGTQECSDFYKAEVVYRYKDFVDDFGKYVKNFGDA